MRIPSALAILLLGLAGLLGSVRAHEAKPHARPSPGMKELKPWGIAGEASQVSRTIRIRMTDGMRFQPDRLEIRRGETVRFVIRNDGRMLHEMVIGTKAVLDEHAALMRRFPDMEHDEPWMAHVEPGKSGEIVWRFNRAGEFYYACLIPGHYEAGMVGTIRVRP